MTRKKWTVALAALLAFGAVAVVRAQGPDMPPGGGPHGRFGHGPGGPGGGARLAEELGLTDAQKAQMEALRKTERESMKPLAEAAHEAHEAFRSALEADNPEATAVGDAALAMHAAEKALRAAHEASFAQMKSILTPEQQEKLDAKRQEHGPHGRGGRGFGRPQPPRE